MHLHGRCQNTTNSRDRDRSRAFNDAKMEMPKFPNFGHILVIGFGIGESS